ncbi:MAG: sporulation peptidase YabG [Bacilli bacterium]
MSFNIGDLVTRNSYNNDTVFEIVDISGEIAYLQGYNIRLSADSKLSDLVKVDKKLVVNDDKDLMRRVSSLLDLNRDEYFYLPGKVLHIDGDDKYLSRCLNFYEEMNIRAFGLTLKEEEIAKTIEKYLKELKPDIVVITGHDAFYKNKGSKDNLDNYKNSKNFVSAIEAARNYEKSQDKLVIIAGACQSDYEELIKAGANFASSPKRINIHALDPAIIAVSTALSERNKTIDLINILEKTKFGSDGIGGIMTNGTMYVGYPR